MKQTIWNKNFLILLLVSCLQSFCQQMTTPTLPKYVQSLGAIPVVMGAIAGGFTITALLIRPVAGAAVDSLNKRNLLLLAQLVILVALGGYGLSNSIPLIFIFRLIHGLGLAVSATVSMTLASDSLPNEKIGQGLGIYSLGQVVAMAIAPSVGLWLAARFGYQKMFLFCSLAMLSALFMTLWVKDESNRHKKSFRIGWDFIAKEAIPPAALNMANTMSYSIISAFIAVYGLMKGVDHIALFFTAYALSALIIRPLSGHWADSKGIGSILVLSQSMIVVGLIILSLASSLPVFILAGIVFGFGFGGISPCLQAECIRRVTPDRRGRASSTLFIGIDIGFGIGPVLGGIIAGQFGYPIMFAVFCIPVIIGLVGYQGFLHNKP